MASDDNCREEVSFKGWWRGLVDFMVPPPETGKTFRGCVALRPCAPAAPPAPIAPPRASHSQSGEKSTPNFQIEFETTRNHILLADQMPRQRAAAAKAVPPPEQEKKKAYFVLVGGEAYESHGKPAGRDLMHTSLTYVASAYAQLRNAGVPREQIITIVQLKDYLDNLGMHADEYPKSMYLKECSLLLQEGGADYDFRSVNPETIWAVLLGRASAKHPKVVPIDSSSSVTFAIYSHGDSHPVSAGQKEETSASLHPLRHEWFCHLPYPCDSLSDLTQRMTEFVAMDGSRKAGHGRNRPLCYLYATQLRAVFAQMFRNRPSRPVVGLLNYCRSGGGLEFMRRTTARRVLGVDTWPLFLMSSCQASKDALVGGLWNCWFEIICKHLRVMMDDTAMCGESEARTRTSAPSANADARSQEPLETAHAITLTSSRRKRRCRTSCSLKRTKHGHHGPFRKLSYAASREIEKKQQRRLLEVGSDPSVLTLQDLYLQSQSLYFHRNKYELKDYVKTHAYASNVEQSSESFDWDLGRFICAGPGGLPDYQAIEKMQKAYRDGSWYAGRIKVKFWHPRRWGGDEVSLVDAVKKARTQIAQPSAVWGHPTVAALALRDLL